MPLFKKSVTDMTCTLPELQRSILRRCRMILVKDIDVSLIIDVLSSGDDGLRSDQRETILQCSSREQRVGALLDHLECRGERTFTVFLDVLKTHYKHLYLVLEEMLKSTDNELAVERVAVSGTVLRRLLRSASSAAETVRNNCMVNQSEMALIHHNSPTADDVESLNGSVSSSVDYREESDYIDCYTVSCRGNLQSNAWIHHSSSLHNTRHHSPGQLQSHSRLQGFELQGPVQQGLQGPVQQGTDNSILPTQVETKQLKTLMVETMREHVFRRIDSVPVSVKQAPKSCIKYVAVSDINLSQNTVQETVRIAPLAVYKKRIRTDLFIATTHDTVPLHAPPSPPPPVPPKPSHLPALCRTTHSQVAASTNCASCPSVSAVDPSSVTSCSSSVTTSLPVRMLSSKSTVKPPIPKKKPHIVLHKGRVLGHFHLPVDSTVPVNQQPVMTGETGVMLPPVVHIDSNDESVQSMTASDSSKLTEQTDYNFECSTNNSATTSSISTTTATSAAATAATAVTGGDDDDDDVRSLNYNVSACSTVDWVYESKKRLNSEITVSDDNFYEPVGVPYNKTNGTAGNNSLPDNTISVSNTQQDTNIMADIDHKGDHRVHRINSQPVADIDLPLYSCVTKTSKKTVTLDTVLDRCTLSCTNEMVNVINGSGTSGSCGVTGVGGCTTSTSTTSPVRRSSSCTKIDLMSTVDKSCQLSVNMDIVDPVLPTIRPSIDVDVTADLASDDDTSTEHSYYEDIDVLSPAMTTTTTTTTTGVVGPVLSACSSSLQYHTLSAGTLLITDMLPALNTSTTEQLLTDFTNTTLAYDCQGSAYYVPLTELQQHGDPRRQPWFYPVPLTTIQATIFLSGRRLEGCFLVYEPVEQCIGVVYNLSVCCETGDVVHYHIVKNLRHDYSIIGHDHSFLTVTELVEYFQRNKSSLATRLRRPLSQADLPVTPGLHYDIKYELHRSELSLTGTIIGKGNFGVICAGVYHNKRVAVKVLHRADITPADEDEFIEEARSLMLLNHDHVLRLVGIVGASRPLFIVTEFAARGSLKDCLRNGLIPSDNLDSLFDVCLQVVCAMQYLESLHYMLHRDIAARNFLVTQELCIKLGDFGRARYVSDDCYKACRSEKICIKWSAPEVLLDSIYSTRSDVWAVGIVFWEILSRGERPFSSLSGEQTAVYVVQGGRLDKPVHCPNDLFNIMLMCWMHEPLHRPSFTQLYDKLRSKSSIYYVKPPVTDSCNMSRKNLLLALTAASPQTVHRSRVRTVTSPQGSKVKTPTSIHRSKLSASTQKQQQQQQLIDCDTCIDEMDQQVTAGTSSSETSLTSLTGVTADELRRSEKIRQSLRKLMNMKPTKRNKLNKLNKSVDSESRFAIHTMYNMDTQ